MPMTIQEMTARVVQCPGVVGAVLTDVQGGVLDQEGVANPDILAATAAFLASCTTRLGDALALGDPFSVLASSGSRRLAFVFGNCYHAALDLSASSTPVKASLEVAAILHESQVLEVKTW